MSTSTDTVPSRFAGTSAIVTGAGPGIGRAKHAVNGLTKSTAFFYNSRGIRANAVVPGGVITNGAILPCDSRRPSHASAQAASGVTEISTKAL